MKKVSIIVPAHNEEKTIKKNVTELSRAFPKAGIIVVCNGCSDNTYEVCSGIKRKNLKVLNFKERIGKGGAILEGFKVAHGNYIGFVDADGSFAPTYIKKVIKGLEDYDCVIASKWKGKNFPKVKSDLKRKIGSRVWNLMARLLTGLDINDTQAGLKFFRRKVVDSIVDKTFICKGFDFDVELLYKIKKGGFSINEVHIPIKKSKKTTFRMKTSTKMFVDILRFYFSKDND